MFVATMSGAARIRGQFIENRVLIGACGKRVCLGQVVQGDVNLANPFEDADGDRTVTIVLVRCVDELVP
jgi:hypothetical protein